LTYLLKKLEVEVSQNNKNKKIKKNAPPRVVVEHLIRLVKTFRIAAERFRLNSSSYEPVILGVCGLIRWRIGAIVFNN
jgi:hypothetical protein